MTNKHLHREKENTCEFTWMGQKVKLLPSMSLINKVGYKNKKEIKKQLVFIKESGRIIDKEDKEDKEVWALIVKDQVSTSFLQKTSTSKCC